MPNRYILVSALLLGAIVLPAVSIGMVSAPAQSENAKPAKAIANDALLNVHDAIALPTQDTAS